MTNNYNKTGKNPSYHFTANKEQYKQIPNNEELLIRNGDYVSLVLDQHWLQISAERIQILPNELFLKIFSYLDYNELGIVSLLSKQMQTLANDDSIWTSVYWSAFGEQLPVTALRTIKD